MPAEFGDAPRPLHRCQGEEELLRDGHVSPGVRAEKKNVLDRYAHNRRLGDALYWQAFAALSASPGARAYYDNRRSRGASHNRALRAVANRLVGILHGFLRDHTV